MDRRFFRERYDAEQILRAVVDEIRQANGFDDVARRVVLRIEAAMHPEAAALLIRQPDEPAFRVLEASHVAVRPIPVGSTLMGLLRLLGKPVEVSRSETGWLSRQLPPAESDFLREARLEWIFPISLVAGKPEGLLVVGPKRSEESSRACFRPSARGGRRLPRACWPSSSRLWRRALRLRGIVVP